MRGYFGIGSERISKAMNLGAVLRTGHAFGASFAFTVNAHHNAFDVDRADTSKSDTHLPLYEWQSLDEMRLPKACVLVGVELDERAIDLPVFRHPLNAVYFLGPEKGSLTLQAQEMCDYIVKIPTKFCVNLSIAAAIVMYDRRIALGGYGPRTTKPVPPPMGEWCPPRNKRQGGV